MARYLQRKGVGPEVRVGLCVRRSLELPVAMLAVLKAGGAYVPLDPGYPAERLAYMMKDAGVGVLLKQGQLLEEQQVETVVDVEGDGAAIAGESKDDLGIAVWAENLAYVMYTSGSTGRPRSVAVSHRNIVRLVRNQNYVEIEAGDVFLQYAPISFDAATFEIYGALLNGGRLVVYAGAEGSLSGLGEELRRQGVTILWLTAGLFHLMVEERIEDLKGLKQLLAGGDVLNGEAVWRAQEQLTGCKVINGYGPTECTTFSCCHRVKEGLRGVGVPIGRPIGNSQVYIVDEEMRVMPVGAAGELYIGGEGNARGYWGRPELTAERYVPNPFAGEGERLYRSGDLTRYREDGEIEFLGRVDQQVKIRGYRIELGEIEAVLQEHEGVEQAAVVVREDVRGEKRLVAYVVAEEGSTQDTQGLRSYLRERLPEYMIPAIVGMESLPLTANGKLDRGRLPEPEGGGGREGEERGVEEGTQSEELLAGIWGRVLQRERVGRHENFFELGGHSLLAMQVIARVREVFGVEIGVRELFAQPEVAGLAGEIDRRMRAGGGRKAPPVRAVGREGDLPLSFAQQRLWFLQQFELESTAYNIPTVLRLYGELKEKALEGAINEIVRRHESLRTTFSGESGKPVQVVHAGEEWKLETVDLREEEEQRRKRRVEETIEEELLREFDLSRGPLLKVKLLRVGEQEHVLMVCMHHIISDGWSMAIFTRELGELYEALSQGRKAELPELPVQYADYAVWQREWLQGEELEQQMAYWKKQLGNCLGGWNCQR